MDFEIQKTQAQGTENLRPKQTKSGHMIHMQSILFPSRCCGGAFLLCDGAARIARCHGALGARRPSGRGPDDDDGGASDWLAVRLGNAGGRATFRRPRRQHATRRMCWTRD